MILSYETLALLVVIFVTLYLHFKRKANYWKRRGVNGPNALPIIGNLLDNFRMANNELEEYRREKYGKVHGLMQGTKPVLTVADPELMKQIMITDFRVFMNHRDFFAGDPFLGRMLPELKDDEWRRVRAIISPAFTTGKLKGMQPAIEKCIQNTFKYLDSLEKSNKEVEIKRAVLAYTLDVIALCAFGMNTNASENPYDEFVLNATEIGNFPLWRLLTKVTVLGSLQVKYDLQIYPQRLLNYFKNILTEVIKQRRQMDTNNVDFVTLLLNAEYKEMKSDGSQKELKSGKTKLTEEDIMANCVEFFLAGYETTSTFLNFTLYALAMHPEIQRKLYEEINEYFTSHEQIEVDSLNALPYFDAVVNESMRLYTPIPFFERICGENYKLGDITIEKGVVINLSFYAMHHDPEYFPNPHQFIPERFLPENKHNIQPYTFVPFGIGPRNCIGNRFSNFHSKLFLANFIKKYEIIKTKNTPEKVEYTGRYLFLACKPIFAAIRNRN